ncbi:LamG domain-containing protein [Akkermansiaceae bacterium]|nr:LamG domain-containing protein [Akkermansiaceae bacterium]
MKKLSLLPAFLLIQSAFADFPAAVVADSPLAYYRFEEAAGATTLVDSSGNGLDIDYSTPFGTTELGVQGAVGLGALFKLDGSFLTPLLLDPSVGDFTIEAVMRTDSPAVNVGAVAISNQQGTIAGGVGRSNLVVNANRAITSFSGGATTQAEAFATEGNFDHIILTFDQSAVAGGTETTFRFFINGIAQGSSTIAPEPADGNWVIGSNKLQDNQFFSGLIDEIAIYGTRLDDPDGDGDVSDSRVNEHYKSYLTDSVTLANFEASVPYLDGGQSAELTWLVSPELTSLTIDDGTGPIDALGDTTDCLGSLTVSPTTTTTYTLTGEGPLGMETLEVQIVVDEAAVIDSFTSNFSQVSVGGELTLSWEVTNGITVEIDNGVGAVDIVSGSTTVVINEDTTFTLSATNSQGTVTEEVSVTVIVLADPTLVTHWKVGEAAGETAGTTLVSESGPSFAGDFVGTPTFDTTDPAPVPGGSTASLVFDGGATYVNVTGYNGIAGAAARTVAFWFKGSATQTNNNATLISWGGGGTGNRFDISLNNNSSGVLRTEVAGSGSNGRIKMGDDTWHHCAVVIDPTVGTTVGNALFYIDGVLDTFAVTGTTEINTTTPGSMRIGGARTFGNRNLTGKLDDIRIYNRALSAEEIVSLITPLDASLEITGITRNADGSVELTWTGAPGDYIFEYSPDLTEGSWFEISDNAVIADGETSGTETDDAIAPTGSKIFYRFRVAE